MNNADIILVINMEVQVLKTKNGHKCSNNVLYYFSGRMNIKSLYKNKCQTNIRQWNINHMTRQCMTRLTSSPYAFVSNLNI